MNSNNDNTNDSTCVVFVTNDAFFDRLISTLTGVLNAGYKEDICIVIGNDLLNSDKLNYPILQSDNIFIKHFEDINFSDEFNLKFDTILRDKKWNHKKFQYHKLHLFDTFFKKWNYVFYIDSGTTVLNSIYPIINARKPNKFLAHSDAYPDYTYNLNIQFAKEDNLFHNISTKYNLNIDFPQTTIMLYDTSIFEKNTFTDLVELAEECPISISNDQGIIALYFASIKNLWEQIKLGDDSFWYYDYHIRPNKRNKPHILVKGI